LKFLKDPILDKFQIQANFKSDFLIQTNFIFEQISNLNTFSLIIFQIANFSKPNFFKEKFVVEHRYFVAFAKTHHSIVSLLGTIKNLCTFDVTHYLAKKGKFSV
jgi:hypothetical protein